MKSEMPYHGVSAPVLRKVFREQFAGIRFNDAESWHSTVLHIWRHARFREERYCAIGLCQYRHARPFQTPPTLPLYEELIVTGAWWDYVDTLASNNVGSLLLSDREKLTPVMREWSQSDDMWKRRTSIICQLKFKKQTDLRLLYDCIEPSIESKEFFLQKAIGWALRQYAWTDAKEIQRYVRQNQDRLSPLSKREALKNVGSDKSQIH